MAKVIAVVVLLLLAAGAVYFIFFTTPEQREQVLSTAKDAASQAKDGAVALGEKVSEKAAEARESLKSTHEDVKPAGTIEDSEAAEPDPQVEFADAPADLAPLIENILAAAKANDRKMVETRVKEFILPDAADWFAKVFGPELGAKLAADYAPRAQQNLPQLRRFFSQAVRLGKPRIRVARLEPPGPDGAADLQKKAFAAMKDPVVLYSIQLASPRTGKGPTLWSFVYAENAYRYVGRLEPVGKAQP